MTKEEAEKRIQELLAEVQALADEHKVEFSWQGCTMHYTYQARAYDREAQKYHPVTVVADVGLLVSDDEWESSNCFGPRDYWLNEQIYPKVRDDY